MIRSLSPTCARDVGQVPHEPPPANDLSDPLRRAQSLINKKENAITIVVTKPADPGAMPGKSLFGPRWRQPKVW